MKIIRIYTHIKKNIKLIFLKIRLRKIVFVNLYPAIHIGKYVRFETDKSSILYLNDQVNINDYVKILILENAKLILGKRVYIGDYTTLRAFRSNIEIGSNTMIAQNVKLISSNHSYKKRNLLILDQDIDYDKIGIKIGNDCWIGAGSIILPGVSIEDGVVVGANSVVTKNLPAYSVVVGNPAKIIKYRE